VDEYSIGLAFQILSSEGPLCLNGLIERLPDHQSGVRLFAMSRNWQS